MIQRLKRRILWGSVNYSRVYLEYRTGHIELHCWQCQDLIWQAPTASSRTDPFDGSLLIKAYQWHVFQCAWNKP